MNKNRRSTKKLINSKSDVLYKKSIMQMRCDEKMQNRDVFDYQINDLRDISFVFSS